MSRIVPGRRSESSVSSESAVWMLSSYSSLPTAFATQPEIAWPPHPRPTQCGDRPHNHANTSGPTARLRYTGAGEVMEVVQIPEAQNRHYQAAPPRDPRTLVRPGDPTPPASPDVAPPPRWRPASTSANVASTSTGPGTRQHQAASNVPLRSAMRSGPSRQVRVRVIQPHEEGYRPDNVYLPPNNKYPLSGMIRTRTFSQL